MRLLVCALLSATTLLLASCAPKLEKVDLANTNIPPIQPITKNQSATAEQATPPGGQNQPANEPAPVGGDMIVLAPDDVPGTVLGSHGTIKLNPKTWYVDAQHVYDSKTNGTYFILSLKNNMLYQLDNLEKQGKVTKLKSGVRYATIQEGSGKEATGEEEETVKIKVATTCPDGTPVDKRAGNNGIVDEMYDVEMVIGLAGGCPGWAQAVKGMKTGEIRIVEVPEELYKLEPQEARYTGTVYTHMKMLQVGFDEDASSKPDENASSKPDENASSKPDENASSKP